MASPAIFSFNHLGALDILNYNKDSDAALRLYCLTASAARFTLLTRAEIDEIQEDLVAELDITCSLTMLAAVEAAFRVDYLQRSRKRLKDPLSKHFKNLYRRKKAKVSLEDEILSAWKSFYPEHRHMIGQFTGALKYRHWLAHGRYWILKQNLIHDFQSLYLLCSKIMIDIPFEPAD